MGFVAKLCAGALMSNLQKSTPAASSRVTQIWLALAGIAGFGFGLVSERRPFGGDILAHPLAVYFILIGAALLAMRVVLARPVPQIISEGYLLAGCIIGCIAFLAGNWIDVHMVAVR